MSSVRERIFYGLESFSGLIQWQLGSHTLKPPQK